MGLDPKASLAAVAAATPSTLINVISDMRNGAMYRSLIATFYGLQIHCNSTVSDVRITVIRKMICFMWLSEVKFAEFSSIFQGWNSFGWHKNSVSFIPRYTRRAVPRPLVTPTSAKSKNSHIIHPTAHKTMFTILSVFLFSSQKHCDANCYFFPPLQLPEHHAVGLKDLVEWSKNFDAPLHWRVRVT